MRVALRAPAYLGIGLVYAWRYTLRRSSPTARASTTRRCSQYAIDALREHGLVRGSVLAGWRLLRCNPWSRGGVDYATTRGSSDDLCADRRIPLTPLENLLRDVLEWLVPHSTSACRGRGRSSR